MIRRHILLLKNILKRFLVTKINTIKEENQQVQLKSPIPIANISWVTTKYHQHALTLLKYPKKSLYIDYYMHKSVEIIFPLRCSRFIFLDETAVLRNIHRYRLCILWKILKNSPFKLYFGPFELYCFRFRRFFHLPLNRIWTF